MKTRPHIPPRTRTKQRESDYTREQRDIDDAVLRECVKIELYLRNVASEDVTCKIEWP